MPADIGVIGLAVMGKNLVLNIRDHGYKVAVFNRTVSKVEDFLNEASYHPMILGTTSLEELVRSLVRPRKILLMVKAGAAVDANIEALLPFLEEGDVLIDGGNSFYQETIRRYEDLKKKGIHFIGLGVSGGEEGARHGPSLMPGGASEAWEVVKPILQSIAAQTSGGEACCEWMGKSGAGHYVKMVHNAIEYSDMQLIAETYDLLRFGLGLDLKTIAGIFRQWNQTELNSYLIEITGEILDFESPNREVLLDKILDSAGQKGTGRWAVEDSLERGVPFGLMAEAVYGRIISAYKEERVRASEHLLSSPYTLEASKETLHSIERALLVAKLIAYVQGFMLLQATSQEFQWDLEYGKIALVWREGCIIKSAFLEKIKEAYQKNPALGNLLFDDYFQGLVNTDQHNLRQTVTMGIQTNIPLPGMMNALAFLDSYKRKVLPANLIQAQRDYFGSHTYERVDKPRGQHFHTDWIHTREESASNTYNI